jgi:murein DD-endopeptidase MepM/ murein hydrolase activator NlpD
MPPTNSLRPTLSTVVTQIVRPTSTIPPNPTRITPTPTTVQSAAQLIPSRVETFSISSPLQGISISQLPQIISNPYDPPVIGKDDAHHGVDFAFYQFKQFESIAGLPVQSIFNGQVAGITADLPPYGNMLIIESELPANIETALAEQNILLPSPDWIISPQLTCPVLPLPPDHLMDQSYSLYVLYGHLSQPVSLSTGETIKSGEMVGYVGNSGMSGNPHLHLEFRIGPSRYEFDAMGHYRGDLSENEIKNYCVWRVSGWFIPFDPMFFLNSLNITAMQE